MVKRKQKKPAKKNRKKATAFTLESKQVRSLEMLSAYSGFPVSWALRDIIPSPMVVELLNEYCKVFRDPSEFPILGLFTEIIRSFLLQIMKTDLNNPIDLQARMAVQRDPTDYELHKLFQAYIRANRGDAGYRFKYIDLGYKKDSVMPKNCWIILFPDESDEEVELIVGKIRSWIFDQYGDTSKKAIIEQLEKIKKEQKNFGKP